MKKNNFDFSHIIELLDLTDKKHVINLQATEKQCKTIADKLGIKDLKNLSAMISIHKDYDIYRLSGQIHCEMLLCDVVSVEDFWQDLETEFSEDFKIGREENIFDTESIYFYESDKLDIGQVICEYISLEIPAYPRKSEEVFFHKEFEEGEEKHCPFAGLKDKLAKKDS